MSSLVNDNMSNLGAHHDIMVLAKSVLDGKTEKERFQTLSKIHASTRAGFLVGAPAALQVVFDIMLNPDIAPQTRIMAAFGVLDRAGHSTKTLHESQELRNVTQDVNEMSAEDITQALQRIQSQIDAIKPQAKSEA